MELLALKLGMETRIRDICERVKHNLLLKGLPPATGAEKELLEKTKRHGTTILALKCDEGIIMASDRRCMSGGVIFCDDIVKIEEVGALSCMGGAGYVSDFQILADILSNEVLPEFENYWDVDIYIDGQANLVKTLMRTAIFLTWPILAGWNPHTETGQIFLFEPGGAIFEKENYAASGSGEIFANPILDAKWSEDYSVKKGMEIAVEALFTASKHDPNTSDPFLHPPIIKVMAAEQIFTIPEKIIRKIAEKIYLQKKAQKEK